MYQIGEQVVYGVHGVCQVVDRENRQMDGKMHMYLVLEPMGHTGSRFLVPTHNEAALSKLKKMLTTQEMQMLFDKVKESGDCWIPEENRRKQVYRTMISSGDRGTLMGMVRSLYCRKSKQTASGRKIHLCDENFLRDAEKLLAGEIAIVMGMDQSQAVEYLRGKLKEDA